MNVYSRFAFITITFVMAAAPIVRERNLAGISALVEIEASQLAPLALLYRFASATIIVVFTLGAMRYFFGTQPQTKVPLGRGLVCGFLIYVISNYVISGSFGVQYQIQHQVIYSIMLVVLLYALPAAVSTDASSNPVGVIRDCLMAFSTLGLVVLIVDMPLVMQLNYGSGVLGFRYWGLAGHANSMGSLAAVFLCSLYAVPYSNRLLAWTAASVGIISLLLSQSKTSWVAAIIALAYMRSIHRRQTIPHENTIVRDNNTKRQLLYCIICICSILLILQIGFNAIGQLQIFADSESGSEIMTLTNRTTIWGLVFNIWTENIVFGYGASFLNEAHRNMLGQPFARHAHNQYLQTLGAAGLVGLLGFLIYIGLLLRYSMRARHHSRGFSMALFAFIAIRTLTEVPLDVRAPVTNDFFIHLALLATCISLGSLDSNGSPVNVLSNSLSSK